MGIPLDMMTITIAAITIGIAVDNSIHYIYRFRKFKKLTIMKRHWTDVIKLLELQINTSLQSSWFFYFGTIKFHTNDLFWGFYRHMLLAMISVLTLLPSY